MTRESSLAPPADRPRTWVRRLNQPDTQAELANVRQSVNRGAPFGDEAWRVRTATRLGLEASLNPRGRPRKEAEQLNVPFIARFDVSLDARVRSAGGHK